MRFLIRSGIILVVIAMWGHVRPAAAQACANVVKLNPALAADEDVWTDYTIAGDTVFFRVIPPTGAARLYAISTSGSNRVLLSNNVSPQVVPSPFVVSDDGATVLYIAPDDQNGRQELFAIQAPNLTPQFIGTTDQDFINNDPPFALSPDGEYLAYLNNPNTGAANEDRVRLERTDSTVAVATVEDTIGQFGFSPDSNYFVYRDSSGVSYIATGATNSTSAGPGTGGFFIAPDSSRVVWIDGSTLYSAAFGSFGNVALASDLTVSGDVVEISEDSNWVVYDTNFNFNFEATIRSVPILGTANSEFIASNVDKSRISPGSDRVVFIRRDLLSNPSRFELFSEPIATGTETLLNPSGNVSNFVISPDGTQVLARVDVNFNDANELFIVPITGGTPRRVNGTLASGGDVAFFDFAFSPDGSRIVYVADQDTDGQRELYSVTTSGGTPVKLNDTLVNNGDVSNEGTGFIISEDGSRVIYLADQDTNGQDELYSVLIDCDSAPNPYDVDGNGTVAATDAQIVIGSIGQAVPPADAAADVNGDNRITPADAIAVINRIEQ